MTDHSSPCGLLSEMVPKVAVIENELHSFGNIFERLDKTLSALTEISNSLQQIMAVQDNRLSGTEENIKDLNQANENRRSQIAEEINDFRKEVKSEIESVKKDIQSINKWRWTIYGGALVIGIVVSQFVPHIISFL